MDLVRETIDCKKAERLKGEDADMIYNNMEACLLVDDGDKSDKCIGILYNCLLNSNSVKVVRHVYWNINFNKLCAFDYNISCSCVD